ncbi:hypothetical protein [Candidatus Nanohalobium constans]|uniref:DUF92 domain-containing protein n=1 Tax=Candidatus Nanohalobium constans TaxID=2565781 RepID=A0A5Q0UFT0_9ARCH|nr:hypothetical protein [Candidatus Nanohalobium constans]QGA80241.1 hypothetical protein LC1Nh_0340 [Candidatus Nanohalobium constans]
MEILGREISFTPFNVGFVIGTLSVVAIFYVESSLARNFLGFLIGLGFSPAFTSESSHSNRYFALAFVFIAFTLMILAGFRWPLIISFFILAISATVEADSRATMEAVRKCREENPGY